MKYRYRMLLATALSFFHISSGLSMNQEEQDALDALHSTVSPKLDLREFVKNFVPANSSISINFFLKSKGRLFLTCLTPSPSTKIDEFVKSSKEEFPGYLFNRLETELIDSSRFGESNVIEVRKPDGEKSAHFFQIRKRKGGRDILITDRVMHYHTFETLMHFLGEEFKILETCIIPPKENTGIDHMISIVAEKL